MGINEAVEAIEKFLLTYDGGSGKPAAVHVRPSGGSVDEIKVTIELSLSKRKIDVHAYERACTAAIHQALPQTAPFKLHVRAEADPFTLP
jgi:hypothetical protein